MKTRLYILALMIALASPMAHARGPKGGSHDGGPADPRNFRPDQRMDQRPMMIPNDTRSSHRRQSAKCMNAYPDDHSGFSGCIRDQGGYGGRQQYMPMPASDNDYY